MNKKKRSGLLLNVSIVILTSIAALFLSDRLLATFGFPASIAPPVSHPPLAQEIRESIEFQYRFETNIHGLRYRQVPTVKSDGTHRVFVVGDSFTEGVGVANEFRFTNLLEQRYASSKVLFINGGLSRSWPEKYKKLFLELEPSYNPDSLLICVFVNDVAETPETMPNLESDQGIFVRRMRKSWPHILTLFETAIDRQSRLEKIRTTDFVNTIQQEAEKRLTPPAAFEEWKKAVPINLIEAVNQGKFNGSILSMGLFYPKYWSDSLDISNARARRKFDKMSQALEELVLTAKKKNIQTALIFIPVYFQYDPRTHKTSNPWVRTGTEVRAEWLTQESKLQKQLRAFSRTQQIPFLDLTNEFRMATKENSQLNWELDEHLNVAGHQLVATAIAQWIDNENVFRFN